MVYFFVGRVHVSTPTFGDKRIRLSSYAHVVQERNRSFAVCFNDRRNFLLFLSLIEREKHKIASETNEWFTDTHIHQSCVFKNWTWSLITVIRCNCLRKRNVCDDYVYEKFLESHPMRKVFECIAVETTFRIVYVFKTNKRQKLSPWYRERERKETE